MTSVADDPITQRVEAMLADILPAGGPAPPDAPLRARGLDSLGATRLVLELAEEFGVEVPMGWLADCRGAADLARRVGAQAPAGAGATTGRAGPRPDPAARHEPFPLTALQQAYLLGKHPDATRDPVGCHIYREFEVADLDVARLRAAWHRVVSHHDALRLVTTEDQLQRVRPDPPAGQVPVHEVPAGQPAGPVVATVRSRLSHRRYQPGQWPPYAVEVTHRRDGPSVVHLSIDAMVTDGAGLDLVLEHWWRWYQDPDWSPPPPRCTVRDCVLSLVSYAGIPAHARDLDYWVERLAGMPGPPGGLAGTVPAPAGPAGGLIRRPLSAELPAGQWRRLREHADSLGVSPTALVLTAFADTLIRHGAAEPYTLLLTTNQRGRLPSAAAEVVGPFTSTTVLVVDGLAERTVAEAARHLHHRLWADLDHAGVSGVEVLRAVRARQPGTTAPALPVVFTSLLEAGRTAPSGGFAGTVSYLLSQTSGVALDAQLWEHAGRLCARWDVTDALLPPGAADVLFASFRNALELLSSGAAPAQRRPLNQLQQAYVVSRVSAPPGGWDGCQVYHSFHVRDLDVARLSAAWCRLVAAYEPLRSTVGRDGALLVLPQGPPRWHIPVTGAGPPDLAGSRAGSLVSRAFPLDRWPQFDLRITPGPGGTDTVHLTLDLTVCDGRSLHFLMRELFRLYADPAAPPRPAVPFEDYSAWQRAVDPPARAAATAHWRDRLAGMPPGPGLPMAGAVAGVRHRVRHGARVTGWAAVRDRASRAGLSADALLLAAFTEALAAGFREPFAVPVVRWAEPVERFRPGEFTVLSWVAHEPDLALWERARRYQDLLDADATADVVEALALLRQIVLRQRRAGGYAYPVVYTGLLDLADQPLPDGVTAGDWLTCTPDVSLDCISMDTGDGELSLWWDVVEADFAAGVPERMFGRYAAAVRGLADPPHRMSPRQRHQILHEWNDTARPFRADGPVHLRFEEQARRQPEAVAVRGRGGTMTYRELNRRANAEAWRLRDLGIGAGDVVGVCGRRGPGLVVAVYAVLKAGGAYLPLEPHLPERRAVGMLSEAGARALLLTTPGASPWQPPEGVRVRELDPDPPPAGDTRADRDPEPPAGPDDLAYIIYTSGSTGRPKGVEVTHRPLHNLFQWCARMFHFDGSDLGLCVTSLGFDLSVFDILGLLGQGAALYLADEEQQRDPQLLCDVLRSEQITFWNSAPTTLNQLVPHFPPPGGPGTDHLRLVFLSGDYTPLELPAELGAAFPRARLVSLGGATEATVWSNYFVVTGVDPAWRSIPYGRPIDNCHYYVLDEQLEPCPPGQPGDLYIGGACLSRGYVNRPDLTGERFLADPFSERPGERIYRTGDRASYYPDGVINFLGRLDNQVKIRGFRVELGEVEHRLRQHPAVRDVVVVARPAAAGDRILVAYVVPTGGSGGPAGGDPPVTATALRRHAAEALPDYMVPNQVALLAGFPATANGKLDRDALPWPVPDPPVADPPVADPPVADPPVVREESPVGAARVPAVAEVSAQLQEVLAGLLPAGRVDPERDLWDQGATSFTMVQVSGALQRRYQRRIPVETLLVEPTVEGIARAVSTTLVGPGPAAAPPASVDFLDPAQRGQFAVAGRNLRPAQTGGQVYALEGAPVDVDYYRWRATRRDFTGDPVSLADLSQLLGLLRPASVGGTERYLYPSAGDTYAVQIYVHVPADTVTGLPAGVYYHRAREHTLELVNDRPGIDRSVHFYYNRPVYDRAAFEIYLIGQTHGIAPLYGDDSERFLALEAGYLAQVLMTGQAATGLGLCPVGAVAFDRIRPELGLDDGHRFLQAFLGGPVVWSPERGTDQVTPPYLRVNGHRPARYGSTVEIPDPVPAAAPGANGGPDGRPGDLAVIGMAGRYPGADDLTGLWHNLHAGRRSLGRMPAARAAAMGLDGELAGITGGFLADVDAFDGMLFHIAPREAGTLDPRLGLVLATVWRAVEDAGYTPEGLSGLGRVGVFVATMWPDHQVTASDRWRRGERADWSGIAADLPSRVSHVFDFRGPSVVVNTSCASSLEALHLAGHALRRGECAVAVVAAVNLITHPYHLALLTGLDLLAGRDPAAGGGGAFDAGTSGWSPGEGAGAVVLRPAAPAARDGDAVRAVVEATWSGHAGRTARFAAPDASSLHDSMGRALAAAGATPADIDYVECAAAGAAMPDAAELEALGELFGRCDRPVRIGTLKPNIGHLEAASGMSQLAKVLLQMRHQRIAPTLLAERLSPLAAWNPAVLQVADRPLPWPVGTEAAPGRALINTLGATGAYAHAVVRGVPHAPPPVPADPAAAGGPGDSR